MVIPCRDGAQTLAAQLRALVAQESPVLFEVIVADDGSTDDLRAVAAQVADPRIRIGRAPRA